MSLMAAAIPHDQAYGMTPSHDSETRSGPARHSWLAVVRTPA